MSHYLIEQIEAHGRTSRCGRAPRSSAAEGEDHLEGIVAARSATAASALDATAMFVFIGAEPYTDWLGERVRRDARGFVLAGPDLGRAGGNGDGAGARWPLERDPFLLETSLPGVFVAGDVRHRSIKRVASAVGRGLHGRAVHPPVPRRPVTVAVEELRGDRPLRGARRRRCLARWAEAAEERTFAPGEYLMRVGEPCVPFKLLLDGKVDGLLPVDGREERDHVHDGPDLDGRHPRAHRRPGDRRPCAPRRRRASPPIAQEDFRAPAVRTARPPSTA